MVKTYKIIINARQREFTWDRISYEQIVDLIKGNPKALYTITFHHHKSSFGVGGSLTRGESTQVYDGMIINAVITGNA